MFNIDKLTVPIECPSCHFPNSVLMREVHFGLTVVCRGCKADIRLVPVDGGVKKAKRALDNFIRTVPKTITIKL